MVVPPCLTVRHSKCMAEYRKCRMTTSKVLRDIATGAPWARVMAILYGVVGAACAVCALWVGNLISASFGVIAFACAVDYMRRVTRR